MKKVILVLFAFLIVSTSSAQKEFDNEFYFRFGYSIPSWKQFGATPDIWEDGWKRQGYMAEIGTIFMLNGVFNSEDICFGIDVDYLSYYWHKFAIENTSEPLEIITMRGSSKAGPSFTFRPKNWLAIDVYFKGEMNWITGTGIIYDDDIDEAEIYRGLFGVGFCTGINVRLSVVMIGFEFSRISPKLEDVENKGSYLGNFNNENSDRTPFPSVSFSIGLSF